VWNEHAVLYLGKVNLRFAISAVFAVFLTKYVHMMRITYKMLM